MTTPRNATVPAALRPKSRPAAPAAPPAPAVSPPSDLPVLHLALVVPDVRLQRLLKDRVYVIGPTGQRLRVTAHVVLDDKGNAAAAMSPWWRWALVESGLLPPEEVGLVTQAQVELGWNDHRKDTQ